MIKPIDLKSLQGRLKPEAVQLNLKRAVSEVCPRRPNWRRERDITDPWDQPSIDRHLKALASQAMKIHDLKRRNR
jgi:hypothetical protein